jgi:hypothetical protein
VFLGTGLLFVAMLFIAAAVAGGLIEAETQRGSAGISPEVWRFGRQTTYLVLSVNAMRMAGACILVTTTIGLRLGLFPRWLALGGGVIGVVLLLTVQSIAWAVMLFPLWVLVLSIYILVRPPVERSGLRGSACATVVTPLGRPPEVCRLQPSGPGGAGRRRNPASGPHRTSMRSRRDR